MKAVYLLSVIFLLISFMRLKKTNKKESIVSYLIYSIGLLYCYNIVIVFLNKFLHIKGSLFVFSIINILISLLISFIPFRKKDKQKYYFKKEELYVVLVVSFVCLLIGIFRFRGFNAIVYESGDSSIHFRAAEYFSKTLNYLDKSNSSDIMYSSFDKMMPVSYINGGLFLNIFSFIKNYIAFMIYDIMTFIILSLVFVITIFNFFEKKKHNYLYTTIISLLYTLGFPLNNLIFGFCYLGLGVMIFNLLLCTIHYIEDFSKNKIYNIIIIFILIFSVFHSYYLFMPPIYLSLGIYYIYLYKKKKITFKEMFIYGVVTLLLPFIQGFCHYILPSFIKKTGGNIFTYVNIWGYIYDNYTPLVIFVLMCIYIEQFFIKKGEEKFSFYNLVFIVFTVYIMIFITLYSLKLSELYYMYKLFYVYFIFVVITIYKLFSKKERIVYASFILILLTSFYVLIEENSFSHALKKTNIYNWNAYTFKSDRILFNKEEIKLMEQSIKFRDECLDNDEFLLFGWNLKNLWFYSITDSIPIVDHVPGWGTQLQKKNVYFDFWDTIDGHNCAIYYYEGKYPSSKLRNYKILYQNSSGAIVKRNEED